MLERFLKQAEKIVAKHRAEYKGVYVMKGGIIGDIENVGKSVVHGVESGWNDIRDTAETAASLAGNYFLPGSSLLTDQLVSQGSKKQLSSPLGLIGQAGTGLAGAGVGSSLTGISSAADNGAGWGNLASGLSNTASSAGNALGLTDAAGDAAPWVNPDDLAAAESGGTTSAATAQPWANPDLPAPGSPADIQSLNAIAPGASAGATSPLADPNAVTDALTTPTSAASANAAGLNPNNLTAGEESFLNSATTAANAPIGSAELSSLAGSVPASAGGAASTGSGLFNSLKSAGSIASPLISGAGLAMNLLGQKKPPVSENQAEAAIGTDASQTAATGQQLQSYLASGTLPPGAQAGIDQAANSAKAAIRSKYASMGMSGSSSEQQELAAADTNAQAQGAALATQLLNSGISESQLSGQLYQSILNNQTQQDAALSSSIGNFASSLAGGTGTKNPNSITVNV